MKLPKRLRRRIYELFREGRSIAGIVLHYYPSPVLSDNEIEACIREFGWPKRRRAAKETAA